MFTIDALARIMGPVDCCPWSATAGLPLRAAEVARPARRRALYTPEERRRRDATVWTQVQAVLAPTQFAVFLLSLGLVVHFLATGRGAGAATASVVLKTGVLYLIMITGSIWERRVFGRYLFAPAFFWEDAVSMLVLALHTAYLAALAGGLLDITGQLLLALAAYASYVVNATQFVLKLRAARLEPSSWAMAAGPSLGAHP